MSVELTVFMRSSDLPSRDRWQAAVDEAGLPIVLGEGYDPTQDSGAWPVRFSGLKEDEDSGFELYLDNRVDRRELETPIQANLPTADKVVTLRVGADEIELACALFAAAALVQGFGGVFWDADHESPFPFQKLVDEARACARAQRSNDYLSLKPSTHAKRSPVEVAPYMEGWLQCPGCDRRFAMYDPSRWDGEKHLMCGQQITVVNPAE
jgi:hypothetical protein